MEKVLFYLNFSFFLCICFLLPSQVFAAPVVSSVSGTISNGNAIIVSGSGFGSTGPNIVLFDDFEKGTNGSQISTGAQIGAWSSPYANWPTYSNSYHRSGALSLVSNDSVGEGGQHAQAKFSPTTEVFLSYYYYWPTSYPLSGNWKFTWLNSDTFPGNDYISFFVGGSPQYMFGCDGMGSLCSGPPNYTNCRYGYAGFSACDGALDPSLSDFARGRWGRIDTYQKQGISDGIVKGWELNNSGMVKHFDNTECGSRYTADPGQPWTSISTGYTWQNNSYHYYDDFYVATGLGAQARIEIGNAATYAGSNNLAISTATSWSNTSIQATVRQGSFTNGSAYLYVVDSTGAVNSSGYPVTIGGGAPAPTPCNTVTTSNFSQAAYNSYGAPFDAFQTSTNLMDAKCTSTDTHTITLTTGVTGDTTRIVYTKGYYYDPVTTGWTQYSGTCTGALNGEWCQGSVSATITDPNVSTASAAAPAYFVGMTCSVQGGGWKCGCRDTSCTNFYWQIQGAGM